MFIVSSFNIVIYSISGGMICIFPLFQLGMNFETARSQSSILHAFPFNSEKKRGGVAVKTVTCLLLKYR